MMVGIVFPLQVTSLYPKANYYITISDIKNRVPMYCSAVNVRRWLFGVYSCFEKGL